MQIIIIMIDKTFMHSSRIGDSKWLKIRTGQQ